MSKITEKELDLLFPETDVEVAGHTFTLKPFSFHESFIVAEKLKNVLHVFQIGMSTDAIARVIIEARDGVEEIVSMAFGLDVKLVQKLDNKNAIKAIVKIIEVNKDFFSDFVQDELAALNEMMEEEDSKPNKVAHSRSAKQ